MLLRWHDFRHGCIILNVVYRAAARLLARSTARLHIFFYFFYLDCLKPVPKQVKNPRH